MVAEAQQTLPLGVTIAIVDGGRGLPRAVHSALASVRALADWAIPAEVLMVGDRLDGGHVILLQQLEALYYGQGLRLFLREDRPDAGAARDLALRLATYRFVACLGGSDELVADAIPLFYRAMRDTHAALVYGNLIAHRPDGVTLINNHNVPRRLPHEQYTIDICALWDKLQLEDAGEPEAGRALPETAEQMGRLVASSQRLVFVPVVFGHCYHDLRGTDSHACVTRAYPTHPQHADNQADQREQNEPKSQLLRYHPDLGYL